MEFYAECQALETGFNVKFAKNIVQNRKILDNITKRKSIAFYITI